jgi:hypothetical protein
MSAVPDAVWSSTVLQEHAASITSFILKANATFYLSTRVYGVTFQKDAILTLTAVGIGTSNLVDPSVYKLKKCLGSHIF